MTSYLLCCVQRTGSWLLAHSLSDSGVAGRLSDYFDGNERANWSEAWDVASFSDYVGAVKEHATTGNGVFGSKMHRNDFERFIPELRGAVEAGDDLSDAELLERTFPDLRYVWLRREDKVRQGVSWWRADATAQWAMTDEDSPAIPAFDFDGIEGLVRFATACEDGWRAWFASQSVVPLEVTYEALVDDREEVVNRVLAFIGVEPVSASEVPPPRYRQQADAVTDEFVERFLRERSR